MKSDLQLFPHLLIRMGGSTFNGLETLQSEVLATMTARLAAFQQTKAQRKEALSEHLLTHIRTLTDSYAQNQIQNLRRQLYSDRKMKKRILEKAKPYLSLALQETVDEYLALLLEEKALYDEARQQYAQQTAQAHQQLQLLSKDEALLKGLILSSQNFLKKLPAYQSKSPADFNKKDVHTVQSLLKYLTRMQTKTSPFSTFNNLTLSSFSHVPATPVHSKIRASERKVHSHIRLNNYLFKYLKDLFVHSPDIFRHLPLSLNPTIRQKDNHFLYLTNHNNTEAFQRLPQHPVVALIRQLVQQQQEGIRFDTLRQEVQTYVDASSEEVEQYIRQLISYGFLEYDLGISGTDPDWDLKLATQLQPLVKEEIAGIKGLTDALQQVRLLAQQYARGNAKVRKVLLREAHTTFRAACMQLHEAAGLPAEERMTQEELLREYQQKKQAQPVASRQQEEAKEGAEVAVAAEEKETEAFQHHASTFFSFRPEQIFYEDTTRAARLSPDQSQTQRMIEKLELLLRELPLFHGNLEEKEQMQAYFLHHYGQQAHVSLLTFYEDYYRDIKRPEAEQKAQSRKEAQETKPPAGKVLSQEQSTEKVPVLPKPPATVQRHALMQQWKQAMLSLMQAQVTSTADEAHISLKDVQKANAAVGITASASTDNAYGAFVQFYQEAEGGAPVLKGVLNNTFPGYGKMISRFLHIFDQQVTEDIRSWNQQVQDETCLLIEDIDASYFNANLHPPLLPYEIRMPGGHHSLPIRQQLPVTDFEVHYEHELQLVHQPTGKRAYVMDLGFQGHAGRSELFQLLEKFTKADYRFVYPITNAVNTAASAEGKPAGDKKVIVYPRVVYEKQWILQRKTWLAPYELLPLRQPQEPDADYFYRLNAWRQAQQMPEEVFVYVNPSQELQPQTAKEGWRKLGRDDYKPQYVNFTNPLLIHLLEKLMEKVPVMMKFTEMLPAAEHMLSIGDEKYVTEYVVQWYTAKAS